MTLLADLTEKVNEFATANWGNIPNARVIPTPQDLTFGNTGERLNVTVMYADVHRSTQMVDTLVDTLAAEYYKAFLHCAAKIIRKYDGTIQAYDGDRVMAIYTGDAQADLAVGTALEIAYAVDSIINPTFAMRYGALHRVLKHTVGIDGGVLLVAKTGVRVDSDLVWVGPAANYAAKLNSFAGLDPGFPTRITAHVFAQLTDRRSLYGDSGDLMWTGPFNDLGTYSHYRSNYRRSIL